MALEALHEEVVATLTRLKSKHPELKPALEKSVGYAIFPSMGRASAVLGGTYGRGEVYEGGKPIGFASLGQLTLGVQVGGQTFSEVVFFKSHDALDRFKQGRIAFTALELIGLSVTPQHSDARVLDQLIYKWQHSRHAITEVLIDKYADLADTGWELSDTEIGRDVKNLFGGAFENFCQLSF